MLQKIMLFVFWFFVIIILHLSWATQESDAGPMVYFVETIPTLMEDLNKTVTNHTHTVLLNIIENAEHSIDMAVMYWSLLPQHCGWTPSSQNKTNSHQSLQLPDCAGFTKSDLEKKFLISRGQKIYDAILRALDRGVTIRALQSAGFSSEKSGNLPNLESAEIAKLFPTTFLVRTLNMSQLYGDGIQHSKFIIADDKTFLLGSSNFMDFRSLSLVKELGVCIQNSPLMAKDLKSFF